MRKRAEALENLASVHPRAAGLDSGAENPAKIALAILAEILAVRRMGSGQAKAMAQGEGAIHREVPGQGNGCMRVFAALGYELTHHLLSVTNSAT